jgi:hypothetical protein
VKYTRLKYGLLTGDVPDPELGELWREFEVRRVRESIKELPKRREEDEADELLGAERACGGVETKREGRLHWYTRSRMFATATLYYKKKYVAQVLERLEDLTDPEMRACLEEVNKYYRSNPAQRSRGTLDVLVAKDKGPSSVMDRPDAAMMNYNGEGGGRVHKLYIVGVFN